MFSSILIIKRSSRPDVFCKKGVLKNFSKFTGKHLCQSLFSNKVTDLWHWWLWHRCFPVNFEKFLRAHFFIEHLRWLLLNKKMANVNGVMSMFLIKVKVHFTHNFLTFQKIDPLQVSFYNFWKFSVYHLERTPPSGRCWR